MGKNISYAVRHPLVSTAMLILLLLFPHKLISQDSPDWFFWTGQQILLKPDIEIF